MKEAYAVRRTVPPSAEIEDQIDQLLAVGVGENPHQSLSELAKLGAKLAIGTQTVLQGAEDYLVPQGAPTRQRLDSWEAAGHPDSDDDGERKHISPYADQPIGVVQGLRGAYRHLERDLLMARDAIVAMPGEAMESGSADGHPAAGAGRHEGGGADAFGGDEQFGPG